VIEAHFERAFDGESATETHAAEHCELAPAFQQQPDDLQEILVPADRDPVLGHSAEARHYAVVQRLINLANIADGPERRAPAQCIHATNLFRQRLDLQPVNSHYGVAIVHQIVRQRESGRAQPYHQHFVSAGSQRQRPREIQRIPAR
jgi:hypothetical protein